MVEALKNDDLETAERLALEIEILQNDEAHSRIWSLPLDAWVDIIVRGGWRVSRHFGTVTTAPTREIAVNEAIRIRRLTAEQAERITPRLLTTIMAAE